MRVANRRRREIAADSNRATGSRTAGSAGAFAALCGTAALMLGGCGTASVTNAVDPVAKAATISGAAAGYKMNLAMRIASPSLPTPITATGTGSFSPAARTGSVDLSMDFGSIPAIAQVLGSSSLEMQELLKGGILYIKLPAALAGKLGGAQKPWIEFDLAKVASAAGVSGLSSLLNNPASSDPAAMLQYLRATSGGVTKVGTATVNGHATTHYRAKIDLAKYPKLLPAARRAAAQQAISALERVAKVSTFPVDVWIDAQQLVRRMSFSFNEQLPNTSQSIQSAMTIDFTGYGPQPTPPFPSADQVTNFSALASGQSG